jgi:hypothetical protein
MPQTLLPPAAFLLTVLVFMIFFALLFNESKGHVLITMMGHFSFNQSLAAGGARFVVTLWWSLACVFSVVAIWSDLGLSHQCGSSACGSIAVADSNYIRCMPSSPDSGRMNGIVLAWR